MGAVVVVVARRGSDVFIGLSKKEVPAAAADPPPEPVTLLVSMAVLQAAPQAGCVQGPIQPVFSAAASLMFIPGADLKLPSAERERERVGGVVAVALHPFSVALLCRYKEMLNRKKETCSHLNKSLFSEPL